MNDRSKRLQRNSLPDDGFETIFKYSPISTQIFTPDGNTIMVNKAWEDLWQIPAKDIVYNYNILKDKQLEEKKVMSYIKKGFKGEIISIPEIKYELEKTVPGLSKIPYKWVKAVMFPITDKDGKMKQVVLQHINTTEIKQAEEEHIRSEAKFKRLFDANIIGIFISELNGKFLEANDVLLKMIGYSSKDLREGKIHRDVITAPEYSDLSKRAVEDLKGKGSSTAYEKEYIRKDGKRIYVLIAVAILEDTNTCIGFVLDITERKRAELALKISEERFRLLIEKNKGIISILDSNGKRIFITPSVKEVLGYDPVKIVNKAGFLKIHPDDVESAKRILKEIKKAPGKSIPYLHRVQHNNGSWVWVEGVATNLLHESSVGGIVLNYHDVTERVEYENRKDEFISMASHELKTPVTSMKMFLDIVSNTISEKNTTDALKYVDRIKDQTNKLRDLVNDLLEVSQIGTGKLQFNNKPFLLEDIIKDTVESIQPAATEHTLIYQNKETLPVYGDSFRIYQVITNLLNNAIKYSPKSNKIIIKSTKKGNNAIVSVKDFGIGIAKEKQQKIFEKMYQVSDSEAITYPGLGMGLYISREIIKHHGGKIWVKSTKGKGSIFSFSLPLGKSKQSLRQ